MKTLKSRDDEKHPTPLISPPTSRSTKRANRLSRRKPKNALFITERDSKILTAIYRSRYLTAGQVERLFFGCRTRANARLRRLFDHGFVDRHPPCQQLLGEFSPLLYSLGKSGVPIVGRALSLDSDTIARHRRGDRDLGYFQVEHLFAINEFHLTLHLEAQQNAITLETWLSERELQDDYVLASGEKKSIRPDGYGRVLHEGTLYSFFLEADLGTETNGVLAEKMRAYQWYRDSGQYTQTFGLRRFRVVVVTNGERRLANLKGVAQETQTENCWLTTFDAVTASGSVLGSIWHRSGADGLFPFI